MELLEVSIKVDGENLAVVGAKLNTAGVDGVDTYDWEWGILHEGSYLKFNEGQVQHVQHEGVLKLLGMVIQKTGVRLP